MGDFKLSWPLATGGPHRAQPSSNHVEVESNPQCRAPLPKIITRVCREKSMIEWSSLIDTSALLGEFWRLRLSGLDAGPDLDELL